MFVEEHGLDATAEMLTPLHSLEASCAQAPGAHAACVAGGAIYSRMRTTWPQLQRVISAPSLRCRNGE